MRNGMIGMFVAVLLLLAGCDDTPHSALRIPNSAPADLPLEWRSPNYAGGSCLWAATADVLRWHERFDEAQWCRQHQAGGANIRPDVLAYAQSRGLRCVYTTEGDESFLDWCSRTRRAAAVHWQSTRPGDHAVTFCGFVSGNEQRTTANEQRAVIIDNNSPRNYQTLPRAEFVAIWRRSGGAAWTLLDPPSPPLPWIPM